MRQHARPTPRPARPWRRAGSAALVAVAVLLVTGALAFRAPSSSASGPTSAALGDNPTALAPASGAPESAATPSEVAGAASATPGLPAGIAEDRMPGHIALDAWPRPSPAPLWTLTGYVWPLAHPRLTLPFGPTLWGTRVVDGQLFHDGVDLATFCGDRVLAAHDGVVLAAGRRFDDFLGWVGSLTAYYGRLNVHHLWPDLPLAVVTDDGNGYRSIYAHFSQVTVRVGQQVRAGQLIGYEGMTGHATGCHVHYSLYSPLETATFGIEPKIVKDMRLPNLEVARVDPLLVMPFRRGLGGVVQSLGG